MTVLWQRVISVEVAGFTITDPKIEIDIKREGTNTPANGHVSIFNLSEDHERQIYDRGRELTISIGYQDDPAIVFDGVVQRVERERKLQRRVTKIALGGKAVAKETLGGTTQRAYDGEVLLRVIAQDLVADLNASSAQSFTLGSVDPIPPGLKREWNFTGTVTSALGILVEGLDVHWYEEDGVICFSEWQKPVLGAPTIVLTPETGLLESPAVTDEGARTRSLCLPRVRVGSCVELESETLSGAYKAISIYHKGDNWTGSLITELELREI